MTLLHNLKLAFIHDTCEPFSPHGSLHATAEWESEQTIASLCSAWRELGVDLLVMPFSSDFLHVWSNEHNSIDLVHSVLEGWGSPAREGWIASLCELSGVPIIGSPSWSHNLCMKKSIAKLISQSANIPTAQFYVINTLSDFDKVPQKFLNQPHFIKPDAEGSGMGITLASKCNTASESISKVTNMLRDFPDGVLMEQHLNGPEFTTGVLGTMTLPIAQIEVVSGVYGFAEKTKEHMPEKVTFPKIKDSENLQSMTLTLASALGVQDFCRFDWKQDEYGNFYFLEANTLAGLSPHYSVFPKMAEHAGLNFKDMLSALAKSALSRKGDRQYEYGRSRIKTTTGP